MVAGAAKGRRLKTLKDNTTRPTSDKVKEALFSIIAEYIPEAQVLDLFAGTGSLGIEALSRGAKSAVFVENNRAAADIIRENIETTGFEIQSEVLRVDVAEAIKSLNSAGRCFDLIFLDPPYRNNMAQETLTELANSDIMCKSCIIIAERDKNDALSDEIGVLKLIRDRKYKDTVLSFYKVGNGGDR